jgi:hypothetical protein
MTKSAAIESAKEHTAACWAMPECTVCGRRKKPYGRDAGVHAANSYCGEDCPGYHQEPRAGHFWPGERANEDELQITEFRAGGRQHD